MWTGSFDETTFELENDADNSKYEYSGNQIFEIMDFQSEIIITYNVQENKDDSTTEETPTEEDTTVKFVPDFNSYEYSIDGIFPPNTNVNSEIVGNSLNISLDGNIGLLKDYAPPFFLPVNFTYDKYDSPDGFYTEGYNLVEAGGNYSHIGDQQNLFPYEIEFSVTVTISEKFVEGQETETKTSTQNFKIIINRNYSAMRNQFIEGYLEEQIQRGDVEYITYNGKKYYTGDDYLKNLGKPADKGGLQRTKGVDMTLQSVSGNSINNNVFTMDKYIHSADSNGDVYARTDSPYIPYTVVIDGETFHRIDIRLKNIVGVFQQGNIVKDINNLEYEVISVGVEQTFSDEIPFRLFY